MDTFDRISALLKEHGMTQADLSRATGISTGLISQWKKRMQQPSSEKLKAMADYFGVSVDWLLTGTEDKKEKPTASGELQDVYLSFARQAQEQGISPHDIELAIETIKALRDKSK